jgi:hypothetical protein
MNSTERPAATLAERDHAAAHIERVRVAATLARDIAKGYRLESAAERLNWALDFVADAEAEAREGR